MKAGESAPRPKKLLAKYKFTNGELGREDRGHR